MTHPTSRVSGVSRGRATGTAKGLVATTTAQLRLIDTSPAPVPGQGPNGLARFVWLVVAVFVLAVGVFAAGVDRPAFWVDEYLTQVAIAQSWPDLLSRIASTDPGPGPYYVMMKMWSTAATTPGWMRLPSVLAAAAAVVVLAVLVRRLTDTTTAALAAAVLLVLPNVSRYAQENRPYAFALLFTVLSVTVWHLSLERNRSGRLRSRWWSVGFVAAVAGMGLAHLYTLSVLPALAIAAVAGPTLERRRRLLRTMIPAVVGILIISPHIWLNLAHPTGSPTDPPLSSSSVANVIGAAMPTSLAAALGVLTLLGLAVGLRRARLRPALILASVWVLVPLVILVLGKVAVDLPVTRVRYLLFVMPGLALLVALGLRHLTRLSPLVSVVLVAIIALIGIPLQVEIRQVDGHHTDQALDPLLRSVHGLTIPIVTAHTQAVRLVNAATYPDVLLATSTPGSDVRYVAVVERTAYQHTVRDEFPYHRADRWRPLVRCRLPQSILLVVENAGLSARPAEAKALADRLNGATAGRVPCTPIPASNR